MNSLTVLLSFTQKKKAIIQKMYEPLISSKRSININLTIKSNKLKTSNNQIDAKTSPISNENIKLKARFKILENLWASK